MFVVMLSSTMTRRYCNVCSRPEVGCICQFVCSIDNNIKVVVLQHPSEVKQSKGSVPLLTLSLSNAECLVGEDFKDNEQLIQTLEKYHGKIALLYPNDKAILLGQPNNSDGAREKAVSDIRCIVLLDGTWKKAYKMYQVNKQLHALPHFMLSEEYKSLYQVRKTNKKGALSTLEACCHALGILDANSRKYLPLLEKFETFNSFLISFDRHRNS